MRQVRRNVFETNSSSTHSISIVNEGDLKSSNLLKINSENRIEASFGEFGWEVECYDDPQTKLEYLLTFAAEKNLRMSNSLEDFLNCEDYTLINSEIAQYCNCDGIELVNINFGVRGEGTTWSYVDFDGYIDHQSTEDHGSARHFLEDNGLNVIQFVFGNVILQTDNDNH